MLLVSEGIRGIDLIDFIVDEKACRLARYTAIILKELYFAIEKH